LLPDQRAFDTQQLDNVADMYDDGKLQQLEGEKTVVLQQAV
jgi:hypothetical protein